MFPSICATDPISTVDPSALVANTSAVAAAAATAIPCLSMAAN
jgi:hypothetical protein